MVGALALVVTSFAGTAGATPDGAGRPEGDGTIHQTLPIAADSFQQEDDCGSITEGTAWHFILTGAASPAGSTLTATFEDAGTTSAAVARVTGDAAHYYLATADGDVLTAASVDTGDGQLQLSHVCDAGEPEDTEDAEDAELVCPDGMVPPTGEGLVDEDEDGVYADNCVEVDDDETELECPAGMNPPVGGVLVDGDDADELADNCVGSTVVVEVPRNDTGGETPNVPNVPETPGTDVEGDEVVKTPTSPIPTVTPGPVSTPEPVAVPDTPRVLGDTVTRSAAAAQLPRTGTETGLVPFGLALLLVGFALERTAKRAGRIA